MFEQRIKEKARIIGFSHVGICTVERDEKIRFLDEWLKQNYHGEMRYMENPRRKDPALVMPEIRSMIVVGLNYRWPENTRLAENDVVISKYAWSADYHEVMRPMLQELAAFVAEVEPKTTTRAYVDTGPVVEKYWAEKAGIGWVGKHTNVISRRGSSWLFLGELLTDLSLVPDRPAENHCGTCSRCIDVCPTRAILAPYVLDARLCISYLTIELRGSIPLELRPLIGNRIFGCDDCQDVCPWNRFAEVGDPRFNPSHEALETNLQEYLSMNREEFRARFRGTNILRTKYFGFLRNCLVAAGNSGNKALLPVVQQHLTSENDMVREHAQWAVEQLSQT